MPLGPFLHPISLAALIMLAINDHILKQAAVLPGWLTGKLSDFCGLVFFPLLVVALLNTLAFAFNYVMRKVGGCLRLGEEWSCWKVACACSLTAVGFSSLQLWPAAVTLYGVVLNSLFRITPQVTSDPTDLVALAALVVPFWLLKKSSGR